MNEYNTTTGWGVRADDGSEIWDAIPVFTHPKVQLFHKMKLFLYPKKWFTYRHIAKAIRSHKAHRPFQILDVGCGTGATLIDLKRWFQEKVEITGLDVVQLQMDIARQRLIDEGVDATVVWYDGNQFPFDDRSFDAVYTSDVLGHVPHPSAMIQEIGRVLRPGGVFAMFSESALGKHAYVRNYLIKRGVNIDPHQEFHISLHTKSEIHNFVEDAGIRVTFMKTAFWASFFVHPDEFYDRLQSQQKFVVLRWVNKVLYEIKKKLHPVSTALAELYGTIEMYILGSYIEAQGYIVLGIKKHLQ
jgi:ubiquinone/menaquinone biosynthesis C-methylase UbiE